MDEYPSPLMIVGTEAPKDATGTVPLEKGYQWWKNKMTFLTKNPQEEHGCGNVPLRLLQSLEDEFAFELFGTASVIVLDGLKKPGSLSFGEEGCIVGVLWVEMRQRYSSRSGDQNN